MKHGPQIRYWLAGLACMPCAVVGQSLLDPSRLPPQVQLEWTDQTMEWNGLPMQVQVLNARWSRAQLQAWLRQQAPQLQPIPGAAQWQAWDQGRLTTVTFSEVRPGDARSRAVLASVNWSQGRQNSRYRQLLNDWTARLPSGSQIRQVLRSQHRELETVWLLAVHPSPPSSQWAPLQAAWSAMGFRPEPGAEASPGHGGSSGPVFLQAGAQRMVISLVPQTGHHTLLLIQHTQPSTQVHTP